MNREYNAATQPVLENFRSREVFAAVATALQPAEELSGPEGAAYVDLMLAVAAEAQARISNFASHALGDELKPARPRSDDPALALAATDAAFILRSDGVREDVPANVELSLKFLQGAVGGYIQLINLAGGVQLYLNEEGKLHDLPRNEAATTLARSVLFADDFIVGDVVILSGDRRTTE